MKIGRRDLVISSGTLLAAASLGLFSTRARAHEYEVGKLKVEHPWVRAPKDDNDKTAYFFAFIHNSGEADRLIGVKSPHFGSVAFHSDEKHTGAPKGIDVPAKSTTTLAPNGPHVALLELKKHIEVGWGLEMTLVFEKAGEVEIDAAIDAPDAMHAHDAEAMERWQKTHGQDTAGPKSTDHGHHNHKDHDDHHEGVTK
jgi:periplasmic copper chaperone A